jgi:hypothetical protein
MFCSGCGTTLVPGQGICPQCGRPAPVPIPPVPGLEFQIQNYVGKVRALSVVWFIYAAYSLATGIVGLVFAKAFLADRLGLWMHGPWTHGPWAHGPLGPEFFGPAAIHFVWLLLAVRTGLALLSGWGLLEQQRWGRVVAIVAAFLSILRFPFGTAVGIWTLAVLLGYRNSTLYEQL